MREQAVALTKHDFEHQLAMAQQQNPTPEIEALALKKCKMIEAIEFSGVAPNGALLCCQASLAIASVFLPKDKKHTDWCRRKYAKIEQLGYVTTNWVDRLFANFQVQFRLPTSAPSACVFRLGRRCYEMVAARR